jgi:hypothetical protein
MATNEETVVSPVMEWDDPNLPPADATAAVDAEQRLELAAYAREMREYHGEKVESAESFWFDLTTTFRPENVTRLPKWELRLWRDLIKSKGVNVKGQVRDAERNLRSYFRVAIIRAVSNARTDAARWCAGRSNKYWQIPVVLPKSKGHRSERTSCQSSLSNVCPLWFCVLVCV